LEIRVLENRIQKGFTILELMIAVALLAIFLALALPSFRAAIQNNRLAAQSNDLITALQMARSEAIKRSAPVSLCASSDQATCSGSWADGWIVYVDAEVGGSSDTDVGELLRAWPPLDGNSSFEAGGSLPEFLRYLPGGSMDADGMGAAFPVTFQLRTPDCTRDSARDIELERTGRAGASRVACS